MAPPPSDPNTLPSKEAALFRQVIKHYETKQYKKGVKVADTVLKKFPEHGETLAMKGLLLNSLGQKAEAADLVRRGVKANIRSHVCWHVYGLVQHSDDNFAEAMKCYKNALRIDPGNNTVQRDLALLQIQLRDLPGFLETRQAMLEWRSTNRQNWLAFAVAHHLSGHHDVAAAVLEAYEATVDDETARKEPYETSEVLLYKARILEEGGRLEAALEALDAAQARGLLRDRAGRLAARAGLLERLGRAEEAERAYWELLEANPEDHRAHAGLRRCRGAGGDEALHAELQRRFPRSAAARRLPLDALTGEAFARAAEAYVRRALERGVPSLFRDLRPLLADEPRRAALVGIAARLADEYDAAAENDESAADQDSATEAPPAVWARLFLAQAAHQAGRPEEALALADACLAARPRLIDALEARGAALHALGDDAEAARAAEAARTADLADRFVNCVAVRALFRAGRCEDAVATASLFTREGELTNNLYDMQATWYEVAAGEAYLKRQDYGMALKNFLKVTSHYKDFVADQYDFHSYCLRKQTLRAYVDLLRFEDNIYAHPSYAEGACGAVETYLALDTARRLQREQAASAAAASNGATAADAKKAQKKAKKEEQRREKEEAAANAESKKDNKSKSGKAKDPDPHGEQLAATETPLEEADALIKRLVSCAGDSPRVQALAFEVQLRRGRLLQALRAAHSAARLGGEADPAAHQMIVKLSRAAADAPPASAAAAEVLQAGLRELRGGEQDARQYVERWAQQHGGASVAHAAAALAAASSVDAAADVPALARSFAERVAASGALSTATHDDCVRALRLLRDELRQPEAAEAWKSAAAARFPRSNTFSTEARLADLHL